MESIKGNCAEIQLPSAPATQEVPLVKSPASSREEITAHTSSSTSNQEEITTSVNSPLNQQIVVSSTDISSPPQQIMSSAIETDVFSQQSPLLIEHASTPDQRISSSYQVSMPQQSPHNQEVVVSKENISSNQIFKHNSPDQHVTIPVEKMMTPAKATLPSKQATFLDTGTFPSCEEFMAQTKLNTPSQENIFRDEHIFLDSQQFGTAVKVTALQEAGAVDKDSFPSCEQFRTQARMTTPSHEAMLQDKHMTFLTSPFMKENTTSSFNFLSSSPVLEKSTSSASNFCGSLQEDLSTPTKSLHEYSTIQKDTSQESEGLNLCSGEAMEHKVAHKSVTLRGEDQTLEQLISAEFLSFSADGIISFGTGDSQSFGEAQEVEKTTCITSGGSDDHSLDKSGGNPEFLSFQGEFNSQLMDFGPGTPDTLTDPELSKNELTDVETLDASCSERNSVTAKRKVYSKRKHDSKQARPQEDHEWTSVDGTSGVDLTKKENSDARSVVCQRPTVQQIELALGVSTGEAEGQLVTTESGSQFMVVGGQVLEIVGSGENLVQNNLEELQSENNNLMSTSGEKLVLDSSAMDLNHKKTASEGNKSETKFPDNSNNDITSDLGQTEGLNMRNKKDECEARLAHATQEHSPTQETRKLGLTEGLMSRKERDERIARLREEREEAQKLKAITSGDSTIPNNKQSSSSGCGGKGKAKVKPTRYKSPQQDQNKCWIGTSGNSIPKTPPPIKEVIHSAPYGLGRTRIDGQDKLVTLKRRQPTQDDEAFDFIKDGGRFDYDLRPTEGLMARRKNRGTINDYQENTIKKTTTNYGKIKTVRSTIVGDDKEDMDDNVNEKSDSESSMFMDTQNDFDQMPNDSPDSTVQIKERGIKRSSEQTEVHAHFFKTSLAPVDVTKSANRDSQNDSEEIATKVSRNEASQRCSNQLNINKGASENCDTQSGPVHGKQSYSNNKAQLSTEVQNNNNATDSRPFQTGHHSDFNTNTGTNNCTNSSGSSGTVTSHLNSNLNGLAGSGNRESFRNEARNTSNHPSSLNYQPFMGNMCCGTTNHNAAVNGSSTAQQIPSYNGYGVQNNIPNNYGEESLYGNVYSYPHQQCGYPPKAYHHTYAQNYPQMYYQYLRYQAQLRYQIQLKQWYNSCYQRSAQQWYNRNYQTSVPSYSNYYPNHQYNSNYYYNRGSMPNSQNGFNSFQGSYQNSMNQTSNFAMNRTPNFAMDQAQNLVMNQTQNLVMNQTQNLAMNQTQNLITQNAMNQTQNLVMNQTQNLEMNQNTMKQIQNLAMNENSMKQNQNLEMSRQEPLGNSASQVGSVNPVFNHSQVFPNKSVDFRGDVSQNLTPIANQVDNVAEPTDEVNNGQFVYPENEDPADFVPRQEEVDSYNSPEFNEDLSNEIPDVQFERKEMSSDQFINDDKTLHANDSWENTALDTESRKRTSSHLREDFPSFADDHSPGASAGESTSKKICFQEMELLSALSPLMGGADTESPEYRVPNTDPDKDLTELPASPKEVNGNSAVNEEDSFTKKSSSVVNDYNHLNRADESVLNEVKHLSKNVVNQGKDFSSSSDTEFGDGPLPPRREARSINEKNEEDNQFCDLNGSLRSPPGNLNNFALRRRPRSTYSKEMLDVLMREYLRSPYLTAGARSRLVDQLAISEDRILIWFKNQRAKDRNLKKKVSTDGMGNFGVGQLVKLDTNNSNMVIQLQSDQGNQVFNINCNPWNGVETNSEQLFSLDNTSESAAALKDDYDGSSNMTGNNPINASEVNSNITLEEPKTFEESNTDCNMNGMFSDCRTFENQQTNAFLKDGKNKNSQKSEEQLAMNENVSSYCEYNSGQMVGDIGAKVKVSENADDDLSHEQLENLFNNIDGEGPSDDQYATNYKFDFSFEV